MDNDERPPGGEEQGYAPAGDDRPAPARPWHRTPMEPEGPPPWTSSAPGEDVFGGRAPEEQRGAAPQPPPAGMPPAAVPPGTPPAAPTGAPAGMPPASPTGAPPGLPPSPPAGMPPAAVPAGAPPPTPPAPPVATAPVPPPPPDAPRTGAGYARGIFLYIGATSVIGGVASVLAGAHVGSGAGAAVLGVAFVVLFFVAMMLRPGPAMDPVRASLGIVAVLFLVGCFAVAVGAADQGPIDTGTQLVRVAAAAGLFTLGMAGVGMLIPSAVGAGLAMLGLVVTVVVASAAAGVEGFGLAVAAVLAAVVALELAFHAPRLGSHPGASPWMVNVAGLAIGAAATVLGISFQGTAVASAGLVGAALALVAWRRHAVVAAVAAVAPLTLVEGYVVASATSSDTTAAGAAELLVGLVLLIVVGLVGMRVRDGSAPPRRRLLVPEELLLLAAAAMALVALTQVGSGFTPFQGSPFAPSGGSFGSPTQEPLPTFAPFGTPPASPTLPPG